MTTPRPDAMPAMLTQRERDLYRQHLFLDHEGYGHELSVRRLMNHIDDQAAEIARLESVLNSLCNELMDGSMKRLEHRLLEWMYEYDAALEARAAQPGEDGGDES